MLGLSELGIEIDRWACATRAAAGHATIRADVAACPTEPFVGRVEGLLASPPCQDFSRAGKRRGLEGDTGHLVFEVMRWAEALRPLWIACEQVPDVLPIWREFAGRLRTLGYSTWAGVLNAADFGVPQTRQRAFLLAHRMRPALPPEPTHCRGGSQAGLFGPALLPWVSMAQALEWGLMEEPAPVVMTARNRQTGHDVLRGSSWRAEWFQRQQEAGRWRLHTNRDQRPDGSRQVVDPSAAPAPSFTAKAVGQWVLVNGNQPRATRRGSHEPASTIAFGHNAERVEWVAKRPATTVQGCDRIGRPGHKDRSSAGEPQFAVDSVRVSVEEAAILQGFRADYPWQGTKTKRFSQIGNAVPPPLAAAVVGALVGADEHAQLAESLR